MPAEETVEETAEEKKKKKKKKDGKPKKGIPSGWDAPKRYELQITYTVTYLFM